ncbi:cytochrome c oxidase assembly protein [Sulfitobacter sp. PS-8MA]|uniref:cytochrome c oxidase assembly protein n=1 Tax=Sulfitobacter sp. PS-8MA TaxID=3237707 RepID=UPI0034C5C50A
MEPDPYTPFCGTPPLPGELLTRWTLDPALLAGLALFTVALWVTAERRRQSMTGAALVAFLFISPLCAASMALFSARVGQHILLTLVAAPIIAAALPRLRLPVWPMALLFAVLFWVWHLPAPYAATLRSDGVYWAMHLSLTGAAIALFAGFRGAGARAAVPAVFTAAQLTAFAVTLTLAPTAWHDWHAMTALPYGLSSLADQQLAGALMWVAGGGLFMVLVALQVRQFLRQDAVPQGAA